MKKRPIVNASISFFLDLIVPVLVSQTFYPQILKLTRMTNNSATLINNMSSSLRHLWLSVVIQSAVSEIICLIFLSLHNIFLTKRECRTGRISARGLDSTDRAQRGPYKKDGVNMFVRLYRFIYFLPQLFFRMAQPLSTTGICYVQLAVLFLSANTKPEINLFV